MSHDADVQQSRNTLSTSLSVRRAVQLEPLTSSGLQTFKDFRTTIKMVLLAAPSQSETGSLLHKMADSQIRNAIFLQQPKKPGSPYFRFDCILLFSAARNTRSSCKTDQNPETTWSSDPRTSLISSGGWWDRSRLLMEGNKPSRRAAQTSWS